jgi:superfamily II DNA or RNA helicase
MSLKNIGNIKYKYRNKHNNVVSEFYNPCLVNSKTYKRAVGYFSSSILAKIAIGLTSYLKPGHKIQLLISPELSKDDFEVIKAASFSDQIIQEQLTKKLMFSTDLIDTSRYSLLYHLIKMNILEIRFALVKDYERTAIYHEKIGIFLDEYNDAIVFIGSSNETENALMRNYESFYTFKSWDSNQKEQCNEEIEHFDSLWGGSDQFIKTLDVSKAIEQKIVKFSKIDPHFYDDNFGGKIETEPKPPVNLEIPIPSIQPHIKLKKYQSAAIDSFVTNDYKGIFSMSTGSGKTFTASGAIVRTFENKKKLFVVIVAPFLHLVDQWEDELENFNIYPLKIYGNKESWLRKLYSKTSQFKQGLINFFTVVVTNKTFTDLDFQKYLSEVENSTLLIVDEAHNFGSRNLLNSLNPNFPFRLALSATIERHNDEDGTKGLYDYFGEIVIEYDLKQAILDGVLTNYYYYPIVVNFTDIELSKYLEISDQISKLYAIYGNENGKNRNQEIDRLLIRRSRIVAGAEEKLKKLFEIIETRYTKDNNLLIYCGALKYGDLETYNFDEDVKQIDYVQKQLGTKLGMRVSKFTAEESKEERKQIINSYKLNDLQALVAIKCLDEGVNIPAIKTAFILASSTNPRQYIQRRGRLLRTFKGKEFAYIFDFITLTRPVEELEKLDDKTLKKESGLVKNEINRIREFSNISINSSDSLELISKLQSLYKLDIIEKDTNGGDYE